jgi:hypothetical protein
MSAQPYNYGLNATAFSTGATQINSYATSIAQNLPGAFRCAPVSVTLATGTNTPVPASVFSQGSGVYAIFVDGGSNNDLSAVGSVTITPAGTISDSKGFFNQVLSSITAPAGGGACTTTGISMFENGALNSYIPNLFQNIQASLVVSVSAIKLSN